jgi:hypothetical protein
VPAQPTERHTPEEVARLRERATLGHHQILVALDARLRAAGWTEVSEMPIAIDLWGRSSSGQRVIFEAKTLRDGTERTRVRNALAQLLEYRHAYGDADDRMCMATDAAVSARRIAFLDSLGISVVVCLGEDLYAGSAMARRLLGDVLLGWHLA